MKAKEDFSQLFAKIQRKSEIREFFNVFFGHTCQKVLKIARKKALIANDKCFFLYFQEFTSTNASELILFFERLT